MNTSPQPLLPDLDLLLSCVCVCSCLRVTCSSRHLLKEPVKRWDDKKVEEPKEDLEEGKVRAGQERRQGPSGRRCRSRHLNPKGDALQVTGRLSSVAALGMRPARSLSNVAP